MALMTDIRNNLAKLFGVLAFFFIIMIVFDWGLDLSGRRGRRGGFTGETLGSINGKEITYRQFTEMVRRAVENQKQQNNNIDIDEETERQIRSQVWEQLVNEILIDQEIERLGITVTDQEIRDIVQGPNPPEFLVKQFTDSTGTFRRDAYQRAMMDPQNKEAWLQVEDLLRQEQKRRKLQSLLFATINVSEGEVKQLFLDRNLTMDAEYLLFDINRMVPDSAIQISDEDIKKQYEEHPEDFQAKASRKLKYVLFPLVASKQDSEIVLDELNRLLDQARSGVEDFAELAKTYSEIPVSEAFFKHGELSKAKESAIFSAKKGQIVGPISDYDGMHLIKIVDEKQGTTEFVKASHILLQAVSGPDSVKVIQKARALLRQARAGADFAELARTNSQDYGSAAQGGELGWSKREAWVKPFADAAFSARKGEIVGPVRTQFGWHIIKVWDKDKRELKIIDLAMKVKPSPQTTDAINQQAQDFAYLAKEEGFEKAAENSKYTVRETPEFTKGGAIPGLGYNDALMNFAFNGKLDAISEPMTIRNGITVCKISGIREEGIRPFEEVKSIARSMAMRAKKLEIVRARAEEVSKLITPSSDFAAVANSIPNCTYSKTGIFKPIDAPTGIGRDPKFIGNVVNLSTGSISKPFEGQRGYYIVKMITKLPVDTSRLAIEHDALRNQLLQEKRNQVLSNWQMALREKAEIEDHRDKFFR